MFHLVWLREFHVNYKLKENPSIKKKKKKRWPLNQCQRWISFAAPNLLLTRGWTLGLSPWWWLISSCVSAGVRSCSGFRSSSLQHSYWGLKGEVKSSAGGGRGHVDRVAEIAFVDSCSCLSDLCGEQTGFHVRDQQIEFMTSSDEKKTKNSPHPCCRRVICSLFPPIFPLFPAKINHYWSIFLAKAVCFIVLLCCNLTRVLLNTRCCHCVNDGSRNIWQIRHQIRGRNRLKT